ncbi:MFS transporter [Campylobacter sp. MIT 21-1685]|uniref:MFS transporter n=1 Tax=unclassified Campylobacter TaxID=2593542 RepID=UPI00224AA32A|nr:MULTISPECIES: MFS transporter [unclassified Campylobacter]MCX2683512.1 MFS transporter [Campylobacter sp. MIT 21-1684]MCX2751829.1 MFS transporter [Campylobacter sp. MIT 21-1682]MCX2807994.1 MFS transporter [Campylobacter sp. MIT 21-1685]
MKKQYQFHPNDTKIDKKMVEITENIGIKLAVFSMASMTVLGSAAIAPALPAINKHFYELLLHDPTSFAFSHLDILTRLVLTIPAIFVVLVSPLAGILMDKFGKLRFIFPAMIVWTFSGMSGFFLNDIYAILFSRSIFGAATAFIMTGASALLGDYYSQGGFNRREKALSAQGFFCAVGGAVFICIAGFVSSYSWRYPFLVYGLGVLITILAIIYLFEPHKFKFYDKSQVEASVHYRHFFPVYFIGFFIMVVYYISPTQLPYYIEENLGLDPKYIGVSMSVSAIFYGVFSLSYKYLMQFLSVKTIYLATIFLVGCSFLVLYFIHTYNAVLLALALLGMGGGIMLVNNTSYLFSICPKNARARAYGILASCIFLGQFLSPIISQPLVRKIGLVDAFLVWSIVIFIIFFLFFFFREESKRL